MRGGSGGDLGFADVGFGVYLRARAVFAVVAQMARSSVHSWVRSTRREGFTDLNIVLTNYNHSLPRRRACDDILINSLPLGRIGFALAAASPSVGWAVAWKIMPLGDSITAGCPVPESFRLPLKTDA